MKWGYKHMADETSRTRSSRDIQKIDKEIF